MGSDWGAVMKKMALEKSNRSTILLELTAVELGLITMSLDSSVSILNIFDDTDTKSTVKKIKKLIKRLEKS